MNYIVYPVRAGWAVKRDGARIPAAVLRTRPDAVDVARQFARNRHGRFVVKLAKDA